MRRRNKLKIKKLPNLRRRRVERGGKCHHLHVRGVLVRGIAFDGWILWDPAVFLFFFSRQGRRIEGDNGLFYSMGAKCTLSYRETCPFHD